MFLLKTVPLLSDILSMVLSFFILFFNIPLLAENLTPSGSAFHDAGPLNARVSLSISFKGFITPYIGPVDVDSVTLLIGP